MSDATPPAEPDTQPPLPFDEPPRVEPVLVPEPLAPPAAEPPVLTLDTSDESATAALYRAAIGPVGAAHYAGVFARFEARDRAGPHWNWVASLCTLGWMLFRRMAGAALAYVGVLAAVGLMGAVLLGLVVDAPTEVRIGVAATLALLAFVVPGVWGDAWLFALTRKRMAQALAQSSDWNAAAALLERQAVGRAQAGWLSLLYLLPLGGAAALYLAGPELPAKPPAVPASAQSPAPASSAPAAAASAAPQPAGVASAVPGALAVASPAPAASAPFPVTASMPTPATSAPVVSVPMPAVSAAVPAPASVPAASAATASQPRAAASAPVSASPETLTKAARPAVEGQPVKPAKSAKAAKAAKAIKTEKAEKAERLPKKTPAAPPAAAEGRYLINVGLFALDANAQGAYARLRGAGVPATLQELETPGGRRLRVRAGPFGTRAQADAAAVKIRALGLDAVVVRAGTSAAR